MMMIMMMNKGHEKKGEPVLSFKATEGQDM